MTLDPRTQILQHCVGYYINDYLLDPTTQILEHGNSNLTTWQLKSYNMASVINDYLLEPRTQILQHGSSNEQPSWSR